MKQLGESITPEYTGKDRRAPAITEQVVARQAEPVSAAGPRVTPGSTVLPDTEVRFDSLRRVGVLDKQMSQCAGLPPW